MSREYKGYKIKKNLRCEHYEICKGSKKAHMSSDGVHIGQLMFFGKLKDAKVFIDRNDFEKVLFV